MYFDLAAAEAGNASHDAVPQRLTCCLHPVGGRLATMLSEPTANGVLVEPRRLPFRTGCGHRDRR